MAAKHNNNNDFIYIAPFKRSAFTVKQDQEIQKDSTTE